VIRPREFLWRAHRTYAEQLVSLGFRDRPGSFKAALLAAGLPSLGTPLDPWVPNICPVIQPPFRMITRESVQMSASLNAPRSLTNTRSPRPSVSRKVLSSLSGIRSITHHLPWIASLLLRWFALRKASS
jgi:hypothetical protein